MKLEIFLKIVSFVILVIVFVVDYTGLVEYSPEQLPHFGWGLLLYVCVDAMYYLLITLPRPAHERQFEDRPGTYIYARVKIFAFVVLMIALLVQAEPWFQENWDWIREGERAIDHLSWFALFSAIIVYLVLDVAAYAFLILINPKQDKGAK